MISWWCLLYFYCKTFCGGLIYATISDLNLIFLFLQNLTILLLCYILFYHRIPIWKYFFIQGQILGRIVVSYSTQAQLKQLFCDCTTTRLRQRPWASRLVDECQVVTPICRSSLSMLKILDQQKMVLHFWDLRLI